MSFAIKVIIGLGNPGHQYMYTRHNIGFRVIDALAQKYKNAWQTQYNFEKTTIDINNHTILLVKPQTYMNKSGHIIPYLKKQGIHAENILVIHDELEKPFGKISIKQDGSARGHNGLRSIIEFIGSNFFRMRIGISRPEQKEKVADYVLDNFSESQEEVENCIAHAVTLLEKFLSNETSPVQ